MTIEEVKKIDSDLHIANYNNHDTKETIRLWNLIKGDKEALETAIMVVRDKFDQFDTTIGIAICDAMLIDYKAVDKVVYQKLVNTIYTNKDIARIVLDGASNGGCSYLLMTLWNFDLVLTPEQKLFAIDEAMNKNGTTRKYQKEKEYEESLKNEGFNDDKTVIMDIDGCKNPIGQLSGTMYMYNLFSAFDRTQVHGSGDFDIRYWILRNPNFSLEEKKSLVYDFYQNNEEWDEVSEQFMWGVLNDNVNYKNTSMSIMELDCFWEYELDSLTKLYGSKKTAKKMLEEINFCKLMRELRPPQWLCDESDRDFIDEQAQVLSLKP